MERKFLSIIVPAYNEEQRIWHNLTKIYSYFRRRKFSWEMIIVDDGSTDATPKLIKKFIRGKREIRTSRLSQNLGKGGAVRRGVEEARGEFCFFTDVDLATPIEEVEKLLFWTRRGWDIVMGSRRMARSRILKSPAGYRTFLGRIFYRLVNFLFLPGIHDTNCGFKTYKTDLAKKIFAKQTVTRWGFDAEILYIAQKYGAKIKEIPVPWTHYEGSKVRVIQAVLNTLAEVAKIKLNDLGGYYDANLDNEVRKLYGGLGWTSTFTHIRLWTAPYVALVKLVPENGQIVDLGCGEGIFANYLALASPKRFVLGVDKDKRRVSQADRGLPNTKFVNGDITNRDIPAADCILLVHVLHHLGSFQEQKDLLRKCQGKLAGGGKLLIAEIDIKPTIKFLLTWFTDHFLLPLLFERRFYYAPIFYREKDEWRKLLIELGFACKISVAEAGKPFTHIILECYKK